MESVVLFSLVASIIYFLANLIMNRYSGEGSCRSLKEIGKNSCVVFLSVLVANTVAQFLGIHTINPTQKGGSSVAAFTSKPEF